MITPIGTEVMILVPGKYSKGGWCTYIDEGFNCYRGIVSFSKIEYSIIKGVVATNPKIDEAKAGISSTD